MKSRVSALAVMLILVAAVALAVPVQPVKAAGTIYIRADGRIDPPSANLTTADNVTYFFTDDNFGSIRVERDNVVVDGAGFTLQGTGAAGSLGIGIEGANVTIRNAHVSSFEFGIQLYSSSGCRISGNTIANNALGISLGYASHISIIGNTIAANSHGGVWLSYSLDNVISNNTVTANAQRGIGLYLSPSNAINGNNITDHNAGSGIWLELSSGTTLTGNTVIGNGRGIFSYYAAHNTSIIGNTITANTHGISLESSSSNRIIGNLIADNAEGIWLSSSSHNTISENKIMANKIDGIWLSSSSHNNIRRNTLTNNYRGLAPSSSSGNSVTENNITSNQEGIELFSASYNTFYHNNLINNTQQASVHPEGHPNVWNDGYPSGGNYWSTDTDPDVQNGPDQDQPGSDGVGDTPYIIDADNQDRYPLMKPYPWMPCDVGITDVQLSKQIVGHGLCFHVSVTLFNYGTTTEAVNVTVSANATQLALVADIVLGSRASATLTLQLIADPALPVGNYTLTVTVATGTEDPDPADNTCIDHWIFITIPGDGNGDRVVNIFDIVYVAGPYGWKNIPWGNLLRRGDLDDDGDIDIFDLVLVARYYGTTWHPPPT